MDRSSPGEMESQTCVTAATSSAAVATTTALTAPVSPTSPGAPTRPQALPLSPSDRQAVQVIQQAVPRAQGVAAQYLQQMYAAQQQHIMLQTTALQQQQQHLTAAQSLVTAQQASQPVSRQPSSSPPSASGTLVQSPIAAPPLSSLPASLVTSQPPVRVQGTISTAKGGTISHQAMLMGNGSPTGSQAQMYLRTQMLILAPAATVAAMQSELPAVSSTPASPTTSAQLQGALAQNVHLKPSSQGQAGAPPLPKMAICPLKSAQLPHTSTDTSGTHSHSAEIARLSSAHHLLAPGQRGAQPQLIIQQSTTTHRQVQPIALRVTPQEAPPIPLPLQPRASPLPLAAPPPASTSGQPQPAAPEAAALQPGPEPPPPPASLRRLSLHSVQALAVRSGRMLVSEDELPAAEALARLPFQNLPPPQTVAVDLKVQPAAQAEAPPHTARPFKADGTSREGVREDEQRRPTKEKTPTPPTLSASADTAGDHEDGPSQPEPCPDELDSPSVSSSRSVIRLPEDPTYATSPPPPLIPTSVRSTSKPPAAGLPESPEGQPSQAVAKPHILTHLIEGFVIQEGLEPFPVGRSSLVMDQQASLPDDQNMTANGEAGDELLDTEQPELSSDSDMDDAPLEDEHSANMLSDVLQCEFCGKRGYAHTFLRSKRFCSMSCVRRFNVSCTKRLSLLKVDKASRWPHRPMGRRGRPPRRADAISRDHFLRQLSTGKDDGEEPPVPMTTRLRRQTEREREQERGQDQRLRESQSRPSLWTVEQVCSFIGSLPGCRQISEEFRSQEIDGQALLLLTEDHLMNAMNLKLGPALKICAQINTLKEP
ncbi:polyhomeotic-like protein 3 isoform X2 [Denticeps clupeoides]|uniref:polyhomeotic-like protein 3 isoform X2 n=1 Tax=Denticeps clupeoides TaxID=299321 RepID=UPI0010A58395|nr:polyhomeotic-like protein 3 isoform X2 [Denticeps clupeoides]